MIPIIYINKWRKDANWKTDEMVEQDLILSRVLIDLYQEPLVQDNLAFRGGTAIHKLYFKKQLRHSEDLDFVQITKQPIGPVIDAIRKRLDPLLGKARWKNSQNRFTMYYKFKTEHTKTTMKIKIEINTEEKFSVLGYEKVEYQINSEWYSGNASITTYRLDELFGSKLRALYQRKKGRDLFDIAMGLEYLELNINSVLLCFHRYMEFVASSISRAEYEKNLYEKIQNSGFIDDLAIFLDKESIFSSDVAYHINEVFNKVIAKMPGEPWKDLPQNLIEE